MKIERNNDLEATIQNRVKDQWIKQDHERLQIHLSDLLAPRKAYFKRVKGDIPDIRDILYFISGLGIEEKLTDLLGERHVRTRNHLGIHYSPDLCLDFGNDFGILLAEVKSRRRNLPEPEEVLETYDYYLQQLSGYCALDHKNNGCLIVLSLAEKIDDSYKTEPVLASYLVEFTKQELRERRKSLVHVRQLLEIALKSRAGGDFDELPKCPKWMCGREIKTMIKPPICKTCKPTIITTDGVSHWKEFATDWGLKKHKEGKKTLDHEVEYATYEYTFEPTCKFYNFCLGVE